MRPAQKLDAQPRHAAGSADAFRKFHESDLCQSDPEPIRGYKIHGKLGRGGMGSVYLADDPRLNLSALKLVPNIRDGQEMSHLKEWFTRECAATMVLSHPNIVSSYEAGETRRFLFLSLEVLEGGSLRDYLLKAKRLEWAEARRIAVDILSGLEAAHETGIIHRDLKTENIMFTHGSTAKLIDFGLCHIAGYDDIYPFIKGISYPTEPSISAPDGTFGTPEYRAPEAGQPGMNRRPTFDLYSAGIILYEMVVGKNPFHFEGTLPEAQRAVYYDHMHRNIRPPLPSEMACGLSLPSGAQEAIMRSIEKNPDERFQTAAEMRKAIEACG